MKWGYHHLRKHPYRWLDSIGKRRVFFGLGTSPPPKKCWIFPVAGIAWSLCRFANSISLVKLHIIYEATIIGDRRKACFFVCLELLKHWRNNWIDHVWIELVQNTSEFIYMSSNSITLAFWRFWKTVLLCCISISGSMSCTWPVLGFQA